MRITRLVTFTVTAGLVGLTPIAIAAPSQAADNWTTTTTAAPDKTRIVYGDAVNIVVDVDGSDGLGPSTGTSTLYAMEAGSTEFVPVQDSGETTSAAGLLIAAYVVMWVLLLGFVLLNWRRQARVEARISELEKALAAGGNPGGARN